MEKSAVKLKKETAKLVQVRNLVKHFPVENSDDVVRAVDDISFDIFSAKLRTRRRIRLRKIYRRTLYAAAL